MARVLSKTILDTVAITANTEGVVDTGTFVKQTGRSEYLVDVNGTEGQVILVDGGTPDVGEAFIEVRAYGDTSGEGALASVDTLLANGIEIEAAGTGYQAGDVLTVAGGTGTAATLTVDSVEGGIEAVALVSGGTGYTAIPTITITGDGVDADVSVTNMEVNSITSIEAAGTGYSPDDVVTLVGGTSSTPATIKILTVDDGVVLTAEIVESGSYSVLPTNPVAVTGGSGNDATFNLDWSVLTLLVDDVGTGYSTMSLAFDSGNASATANLEGGVKTVSIDEHGQGSYSVLPTNPVAVTGGSGNDDATFNLTYGVDTIVVDDGGESYDNATVTIEGNATATATVVDGVVDTITVTSAGSGYSDFPDVTITAGQDIEYAEVLLRNLVRTFDGHEYTWKYGVSASAPGEATVG